ncbi:MAG: recombinase family protein [Nanoarchaeota archaeon]|nr:recombinase family protein [Nanoarchaeota archaeon]MBU4116665.1 recombinase family protein [Nanoarchaeota archaeon]
MTPNKPLAAIYVRVSTQDQAQHGYSLKAQQEALENYSKALGYEIFKIYKDEGKSAKNMNRPQMIKMLEDAESKKFSAIFIYKLDRFSRSVVDAILTIDKLKKWGIDFVSMQDKIETASATGKLMFHMISAFAEFERNMIGDRTKFGMERKVKEGGFITKAPKGYKLVDKQLVPNEDSENLSKIFEKFFNQSISLTQLAKENNMTASGMKKLLQNTTYIGKVKFAHEESQGNHQPILSKQLFEQVQDKIKQLGWS